MLVKLHRVLAESCSVGDPYSFQLSSIKCRITDTMTEH